MSRLSAAPLRGAVTLLLIVTNTLVHGVPLIAIALVKLALPRRARPAVSRLLTALAEDWIAFNTLLLRRQRHMRWEVRGLAGLDPRGWYLVVANHRSWVDILALQAVLNRRVPLLKFFIKRELRWVPVLGLAWWALDMPFMKRYTREELARRPELRGADLETTRRACERFRDLPTSIINFVEGTRFTPEKAARGGSRYLHLLNPRAGGIAFVLGAMGPVLHELLDVTIAYPAGDGGFWDLCCGRITRIVIEIERRPLEPWLFAGDYAGDEEFRRRFQDWLGALWAAKDARLGALLGGRAPRR
ncbi:MAG TPA: acyltransferase [Steroidobacteraceae bacterium]|nr:acyltransferase [Steroidobacteraceae bacterium]